ncbi:Abscisic acid G-protein coupled receptor-domain-containing protein [Podospora didyma]|uniref:Abscisic acid G-protein coupled receptor-domain-containing protein n=1 Tax=Podospora didyma TaxID=330526 RepID=A0AAE0K191_9PEZI|nr:Abscisic acid G-protein coupled receptor-domain-containing protein [Podospora didyma]
MLPTAEDAGGAAGCGVDSCGPPTTATTAAPATLGTLFSLSPFLATFAVVSFVVAKNLFPQLSRVQGNRDGEGHYLPASAPPSLQQAHAEHGARSIRRRIAALTFAATIGLSTVLAELILSEISELVSAHARTVALRFTVPTLLFLLVVLIPFLELQSVVAGSGWTFQRNAKGRIPRVAWTLQLAVFGVWLFVFWSVGRAVPSPDEADYLYGRHGYKEDEGSFDSTGISMGHSEGSRSESVSDVLVGGRLSRACLERIGVIGISLMALLSGFASVSSPWHTFSDRRSYRKRPITDADIARKQAGLEATNELLLTKRHRLRSLQRKVAMAEASPTGVPGSSGGGGLVGKMLGSLKGIAGGGGGDAAEIKALQMEISGLETMESNLATSLSLLKTRQAAHARDGTALGRLLAIPSYVFSLYCIYRILATTLTTLRRLYYPAASFSSSDPINRFLGLLAKHWDPKLDQIAWARQISFLLSGVILALSANSVLQTFHLFAKWTPGLLYQAQANLALLIGQISATYVISAALLLRSNLPREVGRSVGDALESALEPGFVDRWFEGWFLVASVATAAGIWVGRKLSGAVGGSGEFYDDWDEYAGEEMQKRS